jgi:hypothetical protein
MSLSKEVTFVTSFVDIYESTFEDKTVDWRFNKFKDIAETGIKICVYVSPECYVQLAEFIQPYPNVRIMKQFRIPDTLAAKACAGIDFSLPERRNMPKDVPEYMHLINSKPEFMYDTIQKNPWGSTHFAWIDFSISYVFHKKPETFEYLKVLSKRTFTSEPFLVVPGCWDKLPPVEAAQISNSVYWRFCGGFLLGDAGSIIEFYNLYNQFYPEFLRTHRKLVWEVNFWGWLEANGGWSPRWYSADHNDSIIKTPVDIYTVCMKDHLTIKTYPYPQIETYEPMQASYIVYNDHHILNTRYVNYWYLESGHCHIKHPEDFIISKNLCSRLDPETLMPISINDKEFSEMSEESVGLASKRCYFYGLEDIRLYEHGGKLKFIATNIDYSPTGSNRMIVGEYNPETLSYSNCRITEPPYESWCEKNWIPIKSPVSDENQDQDQAEHFIYKWFPMEIGRLDPETYKLNIVKSYPILAPEFHRARGSTRFIDNGEYLVGLVHLSECTLPRRYYHIMVALDRETLRPLKYSETFSFLHIGIEFCIGFDIRGSEYVFWISTWDRNPMMVRLPIDKLVLKFDF